MPRSEKQKINEVQAITPVIKDMNQAAYATP